MNPTLAVDSAVRLLAALSILLSALAAMRPLAVLRTLSALALAAAAAGLAATLALPALLPAESMVLRPDGSTADPRVISALLVGLAAMAMLLPLGRAPGAAGLRPLGAGLSGVLGAGLAGAVGFMIGLRSSPALAGLALGGFVAAAALVLAVLLRRVRVGAALALQACGTALLVVAAMSSLHGARSGQLDVTRGMSVTALGQRVTLLATEAPHDSLRRMEFLVASSHRADTLRAELRGRARGEALSVAAARVLGGPVLVPLALRERTTTPQLITWIRKGDTVQAGDARVYFEKYRFVMGEPIRLYADLAVFTGGRTVRVSPGATADSSGMQPFEVLAEGYGPVSIARVDADNARVGLSLPSVNVPRVTHTAEFEMRGRPGLELAWAGLGLALAAFLFSFGRVAGAPGDRAGR